MLYVVHAHFTITCLAQCHLLNIYAVKQKLAGSKDVDVSATTSHLRVSLLCPVSFVDQMCIGIHTYVRTHARMRTHTDTYTHTYIHSFMFISMHICTVPCMGMYVEVWVCGIHMSRYRSVVYHR